MQAFSAIVTPEIEARTGTFREVQIEWRTAPNVSVIRPVLELTDQQVTR
jgi:hypothetical protein